MPTKFLTFNQVLNIHKQQIERFGGIFGVRDEGLLKSALAQPYASFGGEFLHPTISEQAAAYLFHITQNHPFIDGNKRTALAAMTTFLVLNRFSLNLSPDAVYNLTIDVAQGKMNKKDIANFIQKNITSTSE